MEEPATTPPPPLPLVYERVSSPERRPPPEVAAVPVAVGAGPPPDSWRRVLEVEEVPRATELVAVPLGTSVLPSVVIYVSESPAPSSPHMILRRFSFDMVVITSIHLSL